MPNRQIIGGQPYRYAYQGQEIDPETGKEAFQLRLWDGRIGRWLTTDPAGQFHSPYLGLGNNPMNGIEIKGSDWWKLTKDGSLVLIKETGDKFNVFYDTEGLEITRTDNAMNYLKYANQGRKGVYGKAGEFINLRMAQADLITLAVYNDDAVYDKMIERSKSTHWYNEKFFKDLRKSGDIPSKVAGSAVVDAFAYIVTLIATRGAKNGGLNIFQKGSLSYKFGGVVEANFDQGDMQGLQNRMGEQIHEMQQRFINQNSSKWNFLRNNIPRIGGGAIQVGDLIRIE